MPAVSEIVELARKKYPRTLMNRVLGGLTSLHRIQGSTGLWNAVGLVKRVLEENGVETRVYRIDNNVDIDLATAPPGWDLVYGEIEVYEDGRRILYADTTLHPTLVAAHSPGGEGEARIVHASIIDGYRGEGDAVLTRDRASLAYHYGADRAQAIVWYSPDRHPLAYPYTGLFLPESMLRRKTPVITIPYRVASRIINGIMSGSSYKIRWRVETVFHNRGLPVLEACIGDGEDVVAATAHICHPYPGAHDNASGSTSLTLAAIALSEMAREAGMDARVCFYWVPEYTGTEYLFKEGIVDPERVVAAINYDMVGSVQEATGSVLHIIRGMLYWSGIAAPVIDMAARLNLQVGKTFHGQTCMGGIRYDTTPYGYGSDHDVFLVNGIESVMVNEWPSRYYHTDADELNTIGWREMMIETVMLTSSVSILASYRRYRDLIWEYSRSYYGSLVSWYIKEGVARGCGGFIEEHVSRLAGRALSRVKRLVESGGSMEPSFKPAAPVYTGVTIVPPVKLALGLGIDVYKTLSKDTFMLQLVSTVMPAMLKGELEPEHIIDAHLAEELKTPSDIRVVYGGEKGYRGLRRLVHTVIDWLREQGFVKEAREAI